MALGPLHGRLTWIYAHVLRSVILFWSITCSLSFNPYDYPRKKVHCDAVQRAPAFKQVQIELSYVDVNSNALDTILMVHGWPSGWSTWSKQIEGLGDEGYRMLVPDLRGFGYSSHTDDFKSSHTMGDLVHDLTCILEHARVRSAICMGHDWGSQVCYEAARMRPDVFTAIIGLVVPYIPSAGPYVSIKQLVPAFPKLAYQTFLNRHTREAANELNRDIRRTLRATMRTTASPPPDKFLTSQTSYLDGWKGVEEIPPIPFFSEQEEDYMVESFGRQGFLFTLGFYTEENRQKSHAFCHEQGNHTLPQPVLSILPTKDPVANWELAMKHLKSEEFMPDLTVRYVEGAHWVQLENPNAVNQAIKEWLHALRSRTGGGRPDDEL